MPLGEIAAGIFEVIFRFIAQFFIEIVIEILVKVPGYMIVKLFSFPKDREINEDGFLVVFAGLIFWLVIGFGSYYTYRAIF